MSTDGIESSDAIGSIVVVGAGLAGGTAVTELRARGYNGKLVLIGAEPHPPYERPPLSKGYLLGNDAIESAFLHPVEWYAENEVELHLGEPVTALDTTRQTVTIGGSASSDAGTEIRYEKLLLATGASPRRLLLAEESGVPTAYLRTIEDSDRLKVAFAAGAKVAIIGAGWIGLEVAAAARTAGCEVTVFEQAELPLLAVLGPEVAAAFAELHRSHGVDLRLGTAVTAADLQDADLVVVGIGAAPVTDLAVRGGLAIDNGVLVDAQLRTSDANIYAIGDIAYAEHPVLGRRIRVEHWDTAIEQGKVAAQNLLGAEVAYDRLPYFFTDQYDLGMEYVGSVGPAGYDRVEIEGDLAGAFRAYWISAGVVVAAMHANDWDASDIIRASIGTSR